VSELETATFDISNGKNLVDRVMKRILFGVDEASVALE